MCVLVAAQPPQATVKKQITAALYCADMGYDADVCAVMWSLQVPLDDGWRYVDALKTRGVESRVLVFPEDSHALDKPQTEVEQWLNIAWWFKQHL